MKITAITFREDDMYLATCPELGVTSQGVTEKEALAALKEATELYLESFPNAVIRPADIHITTLELSHA